MKKTHYILLGTYVLFIISFLIIKKWNLNIYMESIPPMDKVDLKVTIDNQVVFNDTLKQNLGGFPTHIIQPIRIGYHKISLYSKQANFYTEKEMFLFYNQYLLIYYCSQENENELPFILGKSSGTFYFE